MAEREFDFAEQWPANGANESLTFIVGQV